VKNSDRWFEWSFLAGPPLLLCSLLLFGPGSSNLAMGERIQGGLLFSVLWLVFGWARIRG
jgi:hypothetical protein